MSDTILDYIVIALPPVFMFVLLAWGARQEKEHREREARTEKDSTD